MIFAKLQQDVVARLLWDAYFTESKGPVTVIAEQPLDLETAFETAIAKFGCAVIVGRPTVTPTERVDLVNVNMTLLISENVTVNRATGGANKTAGEIGVKCMALLRSWTADPDLWMPFLLQNFQALGVDDDGCDHWALELQTQTMLELLVSLIGTERNTGVGDENGTGLIVSPTAA